MAGKTAVGKKQPRQPQPPPYSAAESNTAIDERRLNWARKTAAVLVVLENDSAVVAAVAETPPNDTSSRQLDWMQQQQRPRDYEAFDS